MHIKGYFLCAGDFLKQELTLCPLHSHFLCLFSNTLQTFPKSIRTDQLHFKQLHNVPQREHHDLTGSLGIVYSGYFLGLKKR